MVFKLHDMLRSRNLALQDGNAGSVFREVHDSRIGPRPNTQSKHEIYDIHIRYIYIYKFSALDDVFCDKLQQAEPLRFGDCVFTLALVSGG